MSQEGARGVALQGGDHERVAIDEAAFQHRARGALPYGGG
jgi:hypothetical protein